LQDTKLFETILGLSGWRMIRRGGCVRTAARSLAGFDHAEERTWRHLFFTRCYGWAVRSRLEPVKDVAATLKPITNGVADQKRIESGQSERNDYDVSSTLTMPARIEIVLESLFRISMSDSH